MQAKPTVTAHIWPNLARRLNVSDLSIDTVKAGTSVGRGTIQRIKAGENVEIASIAQLAKDFGMAAWELLMPPDVATPSSPPPEVREPRQNYLPPSNEELLDSVAALLSRVPGTMRDPFADVLAGWARDGGEGSRRSVLLALLEARESKRPRPG